MLTVGLFGLAHPELAIEGSLLDAIGVHERLYKVPARVHREAQQARHHFQIIMGEYRRVERERLRLLKRLGEARTESARHELETLITDLEQRKRELSAQFPTGWTPEGARRLREHRRRLPGRRDGDAR